MLLQPLQALVPAGRRAALAGARMLALAGVLAALAAGLLVAAPLRGPSGLALAAAALALAAAAVVGLSARVVELRTAQEAAEARERDHAATQERQKAADAELRRLNAELGRSVETLLARNREFVLLGELTALLQGCHRVSDAEEVLRSVLPEFFPRLSGTLALAADGGALVPAASWGDRGRTSAFDPGDCWALRLGRTHVVGVDDGEVPCSHVAPRPGCASACLPVPSQGTPTGALTLVAEGALPSSALQLARAVGDAVGLSLANLRLRETLHQQSISDPLTGLHNRRFMQESLDRELLRARRSGRPVGLCMIDIDHFKRFNDVHGHDAGDAVLLEVGRLLRAAVRASDVVCRYGGEEFTIILPESALEGTVERAEALLRACRRLRVAHLGRVLEPVTISIGVAEHPLHAEDADALLRRADAALYAAKQRGRDRVEVAPRAPVATGRGIGFA